jgi:hypothetical protein
MLRPGIDSRQLEGSSFVDTRLGIFVHVWRSRAAAGQFQEVFEAAAATLTIAPRTLFASPCSLLFAYQCAMITVTWLVPADLADTTAEDTGHLLSVERHADRMFQQLFGMSGRCCFPSRDAAIVYVVPCDLKLVVEAGLRHEHFLCDRLGFGTSNKPERDELAVNRACSAIRKHLTYVGALKHASFVRILKAANVAPTSLYHLWTSEAAKCGTAAVDFEVSRLIINAAVAFAFRTLVDLISLELLGKTLPDAAAADSGRQMLLKWASQLYAALLASTSLLRKSLVPIMITHFGFPSDFSVSPQLLSLKMVMAAVEHELALETKNISGPMAWVRPVVQSFSHCPQAPSPSESEADAQESVKRILHSNDVTVRQGLLLRALHYSFNPSPVLVSEADRWFESSPVAAVSYLVLRNCIAPTEQGIEKEITFLMSLSRESVENVRYVSVRLCDLWAVLRTWTVASPMWLKWVNAAVDFYAHATAATPTLQCVAAELVDASNFLAASSDPLAVLILARNNVAPTISMALARHSPQMVAKFVSGTLAFTFLRSLAADDPDVRCQSLLPLAVLFPHLVSAAPADVTGNMNMVLTGCIGALFVVLKATSDLVSPRELTVLSMQLSELCAAKRLQVGDTQLQWSLEDATLLSNLAELALRSTPYVLTSCLLLAHIDARVPLLKQVAEAIRAHASSLDSRPFWDVSALADNATVCAAQLERSWREGLRQMEQEHYRRLETQAAAEESNREVREKERIARHARQVASLVDEEAQARGTLAQQESQARVVLSQNERTDLEWSDGASTIRRIRDLDAKESSVRLAIRGEMLLQHGELVQFMVAATLLMKKYSRLLDDIDDQEFTERDELKDYVKLDRAEAVERRDSRVRSELTAEERAARSELSLSEESVWQLLLSNLKPTPVEMISTEATSAVGAPEPANASVTQRPASREELVHELVEVVVRASSRERGVQSEKAPDDEWMVPVEVLDEDQEQQDTPSEQQKPHTSGAGEPVESILPGSWTRVATPRNAQSEFDVPENACALDASDDEESSTMPSARTPGSSLPSARVTSRRDIPSGRMNRAPLSQKRSRAKEQGTQTSKPGTPVTPLLPAPPSAEEASVQSEDCCLNRGNDDEPQVKPLSRKSSAQLLLESVEVRPASFSPPLDILYRAAQRCRSFGPALAALLFLDISAPETSPQRPRPEAGSHNPTTSSSPPRASHSSEILAMQRKVVELQSASVVVQLRELIAAEQRFRRALSGEYATAIAKMTEEEDAHRIIMQLRVEQQQVSASPEKDAKGGLWRPCSAERELSVLKERSRRLLAGQRVNERNAADLPPLKLRGGPAAMLRPVNPVSEMLRQLEKELREMDPSARRGPKELSPLVAPPLRHEPPKAAKVHRVTSAQAVRPTPASLSLPFTQSKLLTADKLPPIVASVLADRDFSRADETLPPSSCEEALHTAIGPVMPCVARTAVEIAVQKQQLQMEIERATHSALTHPSGAPRPSSASLRPHSATALPAEIAKANRTIDATCEVQIFARCYLSRRQRVRQAGMLIAHWTFRKIYGSINRKRTLHSFKRARKADDRLLAEYFSKFMLWRLRRREATAHCRDILRKRIVERRVFGSVGARQLLETSTRPRLLRAFYGRWEAVAKRRIVVRRVDRLRSVNEQRHARARVQEWADTFTEGKIHFGPEIRRSLAALRLERKNKAIVRDRYLGKLMNFFVLCLQRREGQLQLYQAYHAVRRQHIEREVDRVWCLAMIKSGWARRYFKQAYLAWRDWLLQRKPHLAKKRKPLYNL